MSLIQAIILGIIEGLTEFLPVSSTGHMILASALMQIHEDSFVKTFEIAIQLGAIMAVVIVYYKRFLKSFDIYLKLGIAFIPTAIAGFLLYKTIKYYLFNPWVVSAMLIIGGIVLILLDKWTDKRESRYRSLDEVSIGGALAIGLFQILSMVPGVSRAAATIFGGIYAGFDRRQAAEFSFLLAVPTMFAATGYDLLKSGSAINDDQWTLLITGGLVAFVFAVLAIKTFIAFVAKYGFKHFGYYRIIIGVVFILFALFYGLELEA